MNTYLRLERFSLDALLSTPQFRRAIKTALSGVVYLSLAGSFFFLFILPTRTCSSFLGRHAAGILPFQSLLIFLMLFTAAVAYALRDFLLHPHNRRAVLATEPLSLGTALPLYKKINVLLSAFILALAIAGLNSPLDIDENIHALMMTRGLYSDELNPVKSDAKIYFTQNHPLAQAASILSMEALGFSKIPYRLPAIGFTLMLLLAVPLLYRQLLATPGYCLLLGFISTSAYLSWYLHSARGYVSMVLLTWCTFLIALRAVHQPGKLSRSLTGIYAGCLVLSAFTHFFAIIFQLLLTVALIAYGYLHRKNISESTALSLRRLILAGLAVTPLFGLVLASNIMFLSRIGDFQKSESISLATSMMKAMGFSFDWQGRALLLLCLILTIVAVARQQSLFTRFTTVFTALIFFFFALTLSTMEAKVFESRFILAFIIPFLMWIVDSTYALGGNRRLVPVVLFLPLIAFPFLGYRALYHSLTINLASFDELIQIVHTKTAPISENCYVFSGQRDLSVFAKDFYLKDAKASALVTEGGVNCPEFYHLRMQPIFTDGVIDWVPPPLATELWNNKKGMALYRQSRRSEVAQRARDSK